MERQLNTQEKVKIVLMQYPKTRNNDMLLYLNVTRMIEDETQHEILNKPFGSVLVKMGKYNLPSFGSVSRIRRKLQEKYPDLRATEEVKEFRSEREKMFREYSKQ